MTTTLYDIVKQNLIKVGDSIEFSFKSNQFRAKIARGGLITDYTIVRPHATEPEKILENVSSFSSLTSFTESCLQDVLEEYFTRYSSWKRVFHVESRQSMCEIRDRCKLLNGKIKNDDTSQLFKEIYRLQKTIGEMSDVLKKHNLFATKWEAFQVTEVASEEEKHLPLKKRKIKNTKAFKSVQKLIISSPESIC